MGAKRQLPFDNKNKTVSAASRGGSSKPPSLQVQQQQALPTSGSSDQSTLQGQQQASPDPLPRFGQGQLGAFPPALHRVSPPPISTPSPPNFTSPIPPLPRMLSSIPDVVQPTVPTVPHPTPDATTPSSQGGSVASTCNQAPMFTMELKSARTKNDEKDDEELGVNDSIPMDPNKRGVRGITKGNKVQLEAKRLGGFIPITFEKGLTIPDNSYHADLFIRYLGHIIREKVNMSAETWRRVDNDSKADVSNAMSVYFSWDDKNEQLTAWVASHCASRFRQWKSSLHSHYQNWKDLGVNCCPKEFANRYNQWEWLTGHYESDKFKNQLEANKRNRQCLTIHHSSGSRSYQRQWEDAIAEGAQVHVATVYERTHKRYLAEIEKVKTAADLAILYIAKEKYPHLPNDQLPVSEIKIDNLESQANIMGRALPPGKNKHHMKGLGKLGNGLYIRLFGNDSSTTNQQQIAELERKHAEEIQAQQEEMRKQQEQLQAQHEQLQTQQEKTRLLQEENGKLSSEMSNIRQLLEVLVQRQGISSDVSTLLSHAPQEDSP